MLQPHHALRRASRLFYLDKKSKHSSMGILSTTGKQGGRLRRLPWQGSRSNSLRTIIGLAALARSGKDTVASMLLTQAEVAAFALADPLKVGCQALFGLSDEQTWDDTLKEQKIDRWNRSPREFFQQVGTEWMRNHNPDHWLQRADREINPPRDDSAWSGTANLSAADAPLRLAAQAFFDFSDAQIWDAGHYSQIDPSWNISPQDAVALIERHALAFDPDYTAKRAQLPLTPLKRRPPLPASASTIIIKDIRFENEAQYLREHHGVIWHITRPNLQRVNAHSSELGVARQPGDVLIVNDGSLEQLQAVVMQAWQHHQTTQQAH